MDEYMWMKKAVQAILSQNVSNVEKAEEIVEMVKEYNSGKVTSTFVGIVEEREIDYGNSLEYITEVRDRRGESLADTLDDYIGKKVRVTVEVDE